MSETSSTDSKEIPGAHGAASVAVILTVAFTILFLQTGNHSTLVLAAGSVSIAFSAAIGPKFASRSNVERMIGGSILATGFGMALVIPPATVLLLPIGFYAGIAFAGGMGSARESAAWVLGGSIAYVSSMLLRGHLGIAAPDSPLVSSLLVYAAPPIMFASFLRRWRAVHKELWATLRQANRMRRELALQNEELEKARRRAEASSLAKSAFLANMSHELRTPLNAVIGYSELLLEEAEDRGDDSMSADLEKIRSSGQMLVGMVSEVLDLAKIESGKMSLDLEEFDLGELLEEMEMLVIPLARSNKNELVVEMPPEPIRASGDRMRVKQVLLNLLGNACKFTDRGKVVLRGRAEFVEGRALLVFEVEDTGIGMSAEEMDIVFEPFSQADESTTRQFGGTGLGLALSKEFCRMMGGELFATSQPGKGSTFTARLPQRQVAPESLAPPPRRG